MGPALWYDSPAEHWMEALPLGNGRLGAKVYGDPVEEHLQLNEESIWAGCPEDPFPENVREHYAAFQKLNLQGRYEEAKEYGMKNLTVRPTSIRSYEPLGDLYISFNHNNAQNYRRSLDLENGICTVEYEINGKRIVSESFISVKYNAVFYNFSSPDNQPVDCEIRFEREKDIKQYVDSAGILCIKGQIFDDPDGYDDNPGGSGKGGNHMKFSAHVAAKLKDGELSSEGNHLVINNAKSFTLIVSAATDYNFSLMNFDRSIDSKLLSYSILSDALKVPFRKIKKEHIRGHSALFNKVEFKISENNADTIPTDKRIDNLFQGGDGNYLTQMYFQYGRYLLMSCSGGRATLPANLQGIWNTDMWAAWESDYHLNINLQMNYWPADNCNLSETYIPLSNFMVKLSERGKTTAREYIGSDGWMAHYVSNPFGRTTPAGSTRSSQLENGYCFPLAGAWISLSLWRHYEFIKDREYLENTVYPVISGAAQFILDFLSENEKGELVTAPSYSPENYYNDPVSGKTLRNTVAASIDVQIIKDIFKACVSSEEILGKSQLTGQIREAINKLPGMKTGADGTLQEWYYDYEEAEPGHRHLSHLYALYPSSQISPATPDLFEAALKTVEKRILNGGGRPGWSGSWVINLYARLFKSEECNKHITAFLKAQKIQKTDESNPRFTFLVDGYLGATAGIAEMLLQSHVENSIHLLPALPSSWPDGHIKGLKARGDFIVDIFWSDGILDKAVIHSNQGGSKELIYQDKSVSVDFKPGEKYTFTVE